MSHGLAFISGLLVGFIGGWILCDHKKRTASETEMFEQAQKVVETQAELEDLRAYKQQREELEQVAHDLGYSSRDEFLTTGPEEEDGSVVEQPKVISAEEFKNDYPDAEGLSLTYWQKSKVLTDEDDDVVTSVRETIGEDGEWVCGATDDDVVYIYNPELDCKYEVVIEHDDDQSDFFGDEEGPQDE